MVMLNIIIRIKKVMLKPQELQHSMVYMESDQKIGRKVQR